MLNNGGVILSSKEWGRGLHFRNQDPRILTTTNAQGDTANPMTLQEGHLKFVFVMVTMQPPNLYEPNAEGGPVLHCMIKIGQLSKFLRLVQNYLERPFGTTEALITLKSTMHGFAKAMLDCAYELVNAEGKSLVYMAAKKGDGEAVRTFMVLMGTNGSRIDGPNGSALLVAISKRDYDITQLLLRGQGLCFGEDGNRRTPLHIAVKLNDLKMVELLIKETPQLEWLNVRSNDGFTPLYFPVSKNNIEIF